MIAPDQIGVVALHVRDVVDHLTGAAGLACGDQEFQRERPALIGSVFVAVAEDAVIALADAAPGAAVFDEGQTGGGGIDDACGAGDVVTRVADADRVGDGFTRANRRRSFLDGVERRSSAWAATADGRR